MRGFQQQDRLDHSEIYAPVAKLPTLRILLAIACKYNLNISQMDVKNAFLNGEIEEEVYLKLPKGIEVTDNNKVLKLQKSLYGLKKSPKNWNDRFNNFMIKQGFERSKADYCLYYKKNLKFYLLLYVDDLIILCEKKEDIERLKCLLQKEFDMTNLGNNNKFTYLGINITKSDNKITLDQKDYLKDILKLYKMENCNTVATPIEKGLELPRKLCQNKELEKKCRELLGRLMYTMLGTRPDICFALSYLSRFQVYASLELWKALKRILRYIKGTLDYKLNYEAGQDTPLLGYTDADWAGDKCCRKSTSGYIMKVYGCTVSWCSSKQQCIALSSTESEYIALGKGIAEGCWVRNLLKEIGLKCNSFVIFVDNQSAIHVSKNPEQHRKLKHIDLKYHFIRDKVRKQIVVLRYICTDRQLADIFTKCLNREKFKKFCIDLNLLIE